MKHYKMSNIALQTRQMAFRLYQYTCYKVYMGTLSTQRSSEEAIQEDIKTRYFPEKQEFVQWKIKMSQFCEKMKLTEKQFMVMCYKTPRLQNTKMQEHLLKISVILKENGYEKWTKFLMNRHMMKFMNISVECISSVLEEHRYCVLKDEINNSGLVNIRPSSDGQFADKKIFERLMMKKFGKSGTSILLAFPMRKIFKQHLPYRSMTDYLASRLEIEERIVTALLPFDVDFEDETVDQKMYDVYLIIERISMLQEARTTNYDILENNNLLGTIGHRDKYNNFELLNAVEEHKKIYGKVNLVEVQKYLNPNSKNKHTTIICLQKLLGLQSIEPLNHEDRLMVNEKSTINAAKVFFLLSDEGFQTIELQKFVYLFIVNENDIKQYIASKKGGKSEKMVQLMKETGKETTFPHMGQDLVANFAFQELSKREKFLQEMQIYFEFNKNNSFTESEYPCT